jgi:hypothetical protein
VRDGSWREVVDTVEVWVRGEVSRSTAYRLNEEEGEPMSAGVVNFFKAAT